MSETILPSLSTTVRYVVSLAGGRPASVSQLAFAGGTTPTRIAKATVIMFPPSLDCELCRFLLGYYGIAYTEVRHTVIFSFFSTYWHGRTLYFPLLYGSGYPNLERARPIWALLAVA